MTAGRYPFRHIANAYFRAYRGILADSTYDERQRRFRRMAKDFETLCKEGKIESTDPSKMIPEDIKTFYLSLKDRGLSQNGIAREITAIKSLCLFVGNNCVEICRQKYPLMRGRNPSYRLRTTPYPTLNRLIETGNRYEHNYEKIRNYAVAVIAYCAGLRTKEIAHANVENISSYITTIRLDVVKGQGSYGEPRVTYIHPSGRTILERYIKARNERYGRSGYLFPSRSYNERFTENTLRRFLKSVMTEIDYDADFREARRTYGQMLIDEGNDVEDVSRVMGHNTSKTTETYYARRTQTSAVSNILENERKE